MYYKLAIDSIIGKVGVTDADGGGARAIELIEVIQALDKRLEALEARQRRPGTVWPPPEQPWSVPEPLLGAG